MNFKEFNLSQPILDAISEMGFEEATEIQARTIAPALAGKDILAQAQTGTGKTAAFCLPILEQLEESNELQALMLAPTRELAIQITKEFQKMAINKPNITAVSIYGGDSIVKQIKQLSKKPQVVVGTPGRVIDLINKKKLKLNDIEFFVLDEVDEMLNMGFIEDVITIEKQMPKTKQVLFFSATMPKKIEAISDDFLRYPENIKVDGKSLTVDKVDQYYLTCKDSRKFEALKNIIDSKQAKKIIIFTQTKRRADDTYEFLVSQNFKIEKIHGDLGQQQRTQTLDRLRSGAVDIIVATDVVARGIDIDGIDLVINLQLPQDIEYYIHRIGRTGRAGNRGEAISIVSQNEYKRHFQYYPKELKCTITEIQMPKEDEVIKLQVEREYQRISEAMIDNKVEQVYQDMTYMFDEYDLRQVLAIVLQDNYPQLSKTKRQAALKDQFDKTHNGGSGNRDGSGHRTNRKRADERNHNNRRSKDNRRSGDKKKSSDSSRSNDNKRSSDGRRKSERNNSSSRNQKSRRGK